jgi:4-hydroxy-4-methyl-2-oxoglutarate aldolase
MKDILSLINTLGKFSTATIHEALGRKGDFPPGIKPISAGMKVCGPAYTIKTMAGDNTILHHAYAAASPGDVLVVDCSGYYEAGYWGDLMSVGAKSRSIAGLVIDGCVRDANDIEAMGFPVFSRGLCIKGTTKYGGGTLNEPIIIGGWMINPGDIIIGDRDGVVVVERLRIAEAVEKSQAREEKESQVRRDLLSGKTSIEIYGWKR